MSTEQRLLPAGFGVLELFAATWAIPTLAGRGRRRDESTPEERVAFYEAVRDVAATALAELDAKPLAQLDERERRLMALLLSYAQIALTIEVRGDGEAVHARDRQHMVFTHEPAGPLCSVDVPGQTSSRQTSPL